MPQPKSLLATLLGVVLVLGLLGALSACGQKGPLYLPQERPGDAAAAPAGPRHAEKDEGPAE